MYKWRNLENIANKSTHALAVADVIFTELHLTLVSQGCLNGIALLIFQDDKYLFVVVDVLIKYFYLGGKATKNAVM